ncbi:MAG: hypothetical protein ACI4I9_08360 [Porcipelethomonas sp.]
MKKILKIAGIVLAAAALAAGVIAVISVYRSKFRKKYITICD